MHDGGIYTDENQAAAILHGEGPCAVIAGPGSGKTHVIAERICALTGRYGVDPASILVLTFSRAAAEEMRSRFLKRSADGQNGGRGIPSSQSPQDVVFGTFHAVFYRILRESGGRKIQLIDPAAKRNYLRHLCETRPDFGDGRPDRVEFYRARRRNPSDPRNREPFVRKRNQLPPDMTPEELQLLISRHKNGLPCAQPWVPALVRIYDSYLENRGCLDFDDMILRCRELLVCEPDVLAHWRKRFSWILVDEFQDVSRMQYETLRLLAAPKNNLFVVGDDDQSIYGFRGADPSTMRRFLQEYHLHLPDKTFIPEDYGSGIFFLNTNYRCDRAVLRAAASLIRANTNRIPKKIRPGTKEKGRFFCRPFSGKEQEYAFIAGELSEMDPAERRRTAVIFRTHAGALGFLPVLERLRIPFQAEGTQKKRRTRTQEEEILGDLAAWYRAASGLHGKGAFRHDLLRIMNRPERYLSGSFLSSEKQQDREALLEHAGFEYDAVSELADDLALLDSLTPAYSMRYLLDSVGYRAFAESLYGKKEGMAQVRDLLADLCEEAAACPNAARWRSCLETHPALAGNEAGGNENPKTAERDTHPSAAGNEAGGSENGKPAEKVPHPAAARNGARGNENGKPVEKDPADGAVRILTMHACKGLEFDRVFIPDLNEGNIPSKRAWEKEQMEEERRLLYVAMTRARHELTLTWLEGTADRPAAPSRFLEPFLHLFS